MTFIETLEYFDSPDTKKLSAIAIERALKASSDKVVHQKEMSYELLAWVLKPASKKNDWGTYYGPMFKGVNQEDGTPVYFPSLSDITPDVLSYWEKRLNASNNPYMKARYSDLLWDFNKKVTGEENSGALYRSFVDSTIASCKGDYDEHPLDSITKIERIFPIVQKNEIDLDAVKCLSKDIEERLFSYSKVRYWSFRFYLMIENKKMFSPEEIYAMISEHEARLNEMLIILSTNANAEVTPWTIKDQAELLVQYYMSERKLADATRVLKLERDAFMMKADKMSPLQLEGNLENLQQLAHKYRLADLTNELIKDIQSLRQRIMNELKPQRIEFEIPPEVKDQAKEQFGEKALDDNARWNMFAAYFIPKKDQQAKSLEENMHNYPILALIGKKQLDYEGRPLSTIGTYEADKEGNLIYFIAQHLRLDFYYLSFAIQEMQTCGALNKDKLMQLVTKTPLIKEDRYDVISYALTCFLKEQWLLFCHLIIPQIERAVCNLVELLGESVLIVQNGGNGFQLRTLDNLLRTNAVKNLYGEDAALYLRIVLTDQRGLNLRNNLCHGLIPPDQFGVEAAYRLFHVLFLILLVKDDA